MTAPANDNYADALTLSGTGGTVSGSTSGATAEPNDTGHVSVWFQWTAPANGEVIFDLLSSVPNTQEINLWAVTGASFDTAASVLYSDYYGDTILGMLQFNVTAGTTYHIRVAGSDSGGIVDYVLKWTTDTANWQPPSGDTSGGVGTVTAPSNDDYEQALLIDGTFGAVTGTTAGAVRQSRDGEENWVWYKWVAPFTNSVTFDTLQSDTSLDTVITIWSGEDYSNVFSTGEQYRNDDNATGSSLSAVTFATQVGQTWHIGVSGYQGAALDFTLSWHMTETNINPDLPPNVTAYSLDAYANEGLVYNPYDNSLWVATTNVPNVIARVDQDSGALLGYVTGPTLLYAPLIYSQGRIYAGSATQYFVFDATTNTLVSQFGPYKPSWDVSPSTGLFWLSTGDGNVEATNGALIVKNTTTGTATATYPTGTASPYQILFAKDGSVWFTASMLPNATGFFRLDPATGAVSSQFSIPAVDGLLGVVYDADTNSLWLNLHPTTQSTLSGAQLWQYQIDGGAFGVKVPAIYADKFDSRTSMVYDPARRVVWLASSAPNSLLVGYSTADGSEYKSSALPDGTYEALAVSFGSVWAINAGGNTFVKIRIDEEPTGVINDRDVWLETYAERFTKVTAQYGTSILNAQTNGTSLTLTGAKRLDLSASSQFFLVRASQVEPLWLTLTPTLRNLVGPPAYSAIDGSASLTPVQDKAQLLYGGMGSDRVTIRATVTDGGVVYADQITLVKLVNGSTTISHVLTNETHALMADSVGNVLSYMGASGEFRVWEGAVEVTTDCTYSIVSNTANMLCSISNLGRYAVTGMPTNVQTATIVLRATYHGTNYDETFIVTKIPAPVGSGGDPATQSAGGKRLPLNLTVPIPGTVWSTVAANQAVVPYGGPVLNDIITEYNNNAVPPFKETRFWNFREWLTLDAKIDGNLLVPGSISADKLSANTIDAISGNFQTLVTDSITANNATINTLIADQITAIDGKFDTLTVGGTQILPNSINTGHVVDNAINVPLLTEGSPGVNIGADYNSATLTGTYPGAATAIVTVTIQVGSQPTGTNAVPEIQVFMDGVQQAARAFNANGGQGISGQVMQVQVSVPAGSHSWLIRFHRQGSTDWFLWSYSASILGVMK